MMSDVVTSKSDAIQNIKNALLGLLLTVSAYLILFTINPNLVNTTFSTIPTVNALPAPINVQPVAQNQWTLSYYAAQYQFAYQEYELELGYALTEAQATAQGIQRGVRLRFLTRANCTAQKATIIAQGLTVSIDCAKEKRYSNYTAGTLITNLNIGTFTELGVQTQRFTDPTTCTETRSAYISNPDRYGEITDTCNTPSGNYGSLQTRNFPTSAECTAFVATLPAGVNITQNCLLVTQ